MPCLIMTFSQNFSVGTGDCMQVAKTKIILHAKSNLKIDNLLSDDCK